MAATLSLPSVATELTAGKAYRCPNGIVFVVKEVSASGLVTYGPGAGKTTQWSVAKEGSATVYSEEGYLAFFAIVVDPSQADFAFVTPDGPVTGCREVAGLAPL